MNKVTDDTFDAEVLKASGVVLVDFWAEWCGPCRAIAPILEEISREMGDAIKIAKVNVDENPQTPVKYGIRSIPTMMLFKGGEAVSTKVGVLPKKVIEEWIKTFA